MPEDLSAVRRMPRSLWALARRLHPAPAPYATTIAAELAGCHAQLDQLRHLADTFPPAWARQFDRLWRCLGEELAFIASDLEQGLIAVDDLPEQLAAWSDLGATYLGHKGEHFLAHKIFPSGEEAPSTETSDDHEAIQPSPAVTAAEADEEIRAAYDNLLMRAEPGPGRSAQVTAAELREQVEVRAIGMFGRPLTPQEFDDALHRLGAESDMDAYLYPLAPDTVGDRCGASRSPIQPPQRHETVVRFDRSLLTVHDAARLGVQQFAAYWVDARTGDLNAQVQVRDVGDFVRRETCRGRRVRFIDHQPTWSGL
ncbi:MAG TPA: hypothetical protein VGL36_35555 [Kribbella sp.]